MWLYCKNSIFWEFRAYFFRIIVFETYFNNFVDFRSTEIFISINVEPKHTFIFNFRRVIRFLLSAGARFFLEDRRQDEQLKLIRNNKFGQTKYKKINKNILVRTFRTRTLGIFFILLINTYFGHSKAYFLNFYGYKSSALIIIINITPIVEA